MNKDPSQSWRAARGRLSVKEDDREFVHYLRVKDVVAGQEPEKWASSDLEDQRWMVAEALLKETASELFMDVRLSYVGMSLADFAPTGYNDQQVARDSDGLNSLDNVA